MGWASTEFTLLFEASENLQDLQEAHKNVKKPQDLVIILLFLVFITAAAGNTHVMIQLLCDPLDLNFHRLHRAINAVSGTA